LKGLRGLGLPKPLIKPFAGEELLTALSRALTAPVNQPKPRGKIQFHDGSRLIHCKFMV